MPHPRKTNKPLSRWERLRVGGTSPLQSQWRTTQLNNQQFTAGPAPAPKTKGK